MDILLELNRVGAVLQDKHFVYKSSKHGPAYINPDNLLPVLPRLSEVGEELSSGVRPDVVLGPDFGGNYLAFMTAEALARRGHDVSWVSTRKDADRFIVEPDRGLEWLLVDASVLVTEDLLTTGSSVVKVIDLVKRQGGTVTGVSVVVNRGGVTAQDLGVPTLNALASVSFEAIDEEACPLCEQGVPIVEDIGHGAAYKQTHPDYHGGYVKLLS